MSEEIKLRPPGKTLFNLPQDGDLLAMAVELAKENTELWTENKKLKAELKHLRGDFSHFHVDNKLDERCALCGHGIADEMHLRSR